MLICRLILEEYVPQIEYIITGENILLDALSRLTVKRNQETTQESTYKKSIESEINDTEELTEEIFLINLKLIGQYQQKDPSLNAKYKMGTYKKVIFL